MHLRNSVCMLCLVSFTAMADAKVIHVKSGTAVDINGTQVMLGSGVYMNEAASIAISQSLTALQAESAECKAQLETELKRPTIQLTPPTILTVALGALASVALVFAVTRK